MYEFFSGLLHFFGLYLPNWTPKEHLTVMLFSVFYMIALASLFLFLHHGMRALLRYALVRGILPIRVRDDALGIKVVLAKVAITILHILAFITGNLSNKQNRPMICLAPSSLSREDVCKAFSKTIYDEATLTAKDYDYLFVLGTSELESAIFKTVETEYNEALAKIAEKPEFVRVECHTVPNTKGETTIAAFVYANRPNADMAGAPRAGIIPKGNKG